MLGAEEATCQKCCKRLPSLRTEDRKTMSCLHCSIGNFSNSSWTIFYRKMLLTQATEEVRFLEENIVRIKEYIGKHVGSKLIPYEEFVSKYPQRINDPLTDYMTTLNSCYKFLNERVISILTAQLSVYVRARESFLNGIKSDFAGGIYPTLRPLRAYEVFPTDPAAPMSGLFDQSFIKQPAKACMEMEQVSVEKIRAQLAVNQKSSACPVIGEFRKEDMINVNSTIVYGLKLGKEGIQPGSCVLLGNKLFLMHSDRAFILHLSVKPLLLIERAGAGFPTQSYKFVPTSMNTVYAIRGCSGFSYKYLLDQDKCVDIPRIRDTRDVQAVCCFNERYVYAYIGWETLGRLDTLEEEAGWVFAEIHWDMGKEVSEAIQFSNTELIVFPQWEAVNFYDRRAYYASSFKINFFTPRMALQTKQAKKDCYIHKSAVVLSLRDGEFTYCHLAPGSVLVGRIVNCGN